MVTMSQADIDQSLNSLISFLRWKAPDIGALLEERLRQGESPEEALEEVIRSIRELPEREGLARLLAMVRYSRQWQFEDAFLESNLARQAWPEIVPLTFFIEGIFLFYEKRFEDSFTAFKQSYHGWRPTLTQLSGTYQYPLAEQWKNELYQGWALVGIAQGLEGLLDADLKKLESGGNKIVFVLHQAREDGQEEAIWKALEDVEKKVPLELHHKVKELRSYIELLAIEDPFEGLRELSRSISADWPEGVDCVEAVREQRR